MGGYGYGQITKQNDPTKKNLKKTGAGPPRQPIHLHRPAHANREKRFHLNPVAGGPPPPLPFQQPNLKK